MKKVKSIILLLIIISNLFPSKLLLMTNEQIEDEISQINNSSTSYLLYTLWEKDKSLSKVPSFQCQYKDIIVSEKGNKANIYGMKYIYSDWVHTDSEDGFLPNEFVNVHILLDMILSVQKTTSNEFVLNNRTFKDIIDTYNLKGKPLQGSILVTLDDDIVPKDLLTNPVTLKTKDGSGGGIDLNWGLIALVSSGLSALASGYYLFNSNKNYKIYQEVTDTQRADYLREQSQNQLTYGIVFGISTLALFGYGTIY